MVPAGGTGKRMGAGAPKQFLMLGGVPMMVHALRALERAPSVTEVVLVVPKEEQARALSEVVERHGLKKVLKVVPGGATRQESVHHGLHEVAGDVEADEHVVAMDHEISFLVRDFFTRGFVGDFARDFAGRVSSKRAC